MTARSFPGIGVAENTTVSPRWSLIIRWSLCAIRRSADNGSPWDPVEITTIFSSGQSSTSWGGISVPSGNSMWPSERPMLTFLRIDRPTSDTLRPSSAAASITCCTRWMFDAKLVTMIRPSARANTSWRCGPTSRSEGENPGRSALVESPHRSNTPSRPSSASLETSAGSPSTGVWSNL